MAYRSRREYRMIGFKPDQLKWLDEQKEGKNGRSKAVEWCIERARRQRDAATAIDALHNEIDELKARMDRIAAFLEFQVWVEKGRNPASMDTWHEEFSQWQKDSDNA